MLVPLPLTIFGNIFKPQTCEYLRAFSKYIKVIGPQIIEGS